MPFAVITRRNVFSFVALPATLPSFNVRLFGFAGTKQIPQLLARQYSESVSEVFNEPYVWTQIVATTGLSFAASSVKVTPDLAKIVVIEVPDLKAIRYEFNFPSRVNGPVLAGQISPKATGFTMLPWEAGTTLSIVDAALFP